LAILQFTCGWLVGCHLLGPEVLGGVEWVWEAAATLKSDNKLYYMNERRVERPVSDL
jgi:hypothetical protein